MADEEYMKYVEQGKKGLGLEGEALVKYVEGCLDRKVRYEEKQRADQIRQEETKLKNLNKKSSKLKLSWHLKKKRPNLSLMPRLQLSKLNRKQKGVKQMLTYRQSSWN